MKRRAAIYGRVSTDDQAERGYSLPSQIEACQNFADQKGFEVVAIYQDDISGAKPITARPDGYEMQRAIEAGQIKTVIMYQVDRLSRDIVDLLTTVRDWLRMGVEIYALDIGQVTSELDIVLVIKGWQGSDERQKIRERTSRGRNSKAKSGKAVGAGTPPYGYTYSDGELFIVESQAQIVRTIFDWYINGDEHSGMMSLVAIAKRLNQIGIPTPSQAKGLSRNHTGWSYVSVNYLLSSETYCGVLRYGKRIGYRGGKRPIEEQILVDVPAIVTREMWELAQARRAYNSKMAKRRMRREYLLRGMIYCGCGRVMVGANGRRYYCTRRHINRMLSGEPCHEPNISSKLIERFTWDYVMGLIADPVQFEHKLRQAQAQEAATMQPKQKELENLIALLNDTEREADIIALEIRKAKGIIRAKLEQHGEEVDKRYQALTKRKTELEEVATFELTESTMDNLLEFRKAVEVGLENPTFEDKRRWLEILQVTIAVRERHAVITCRISSKPFVFNLSDREKSFEFTSF